MSLRVFLIVSCLPSVLLMAYIYKKDRVEKEPIKLLLLLFVLGAAICFPVSLLESWLSGIYAEAFGEDTILYQFFENFLNIALFEESFKFLALFLVTHKSKHFNSLFDGIVYAVFVSLGFATLENVLYVYNFGLGNGLLRAVTAVPGHMFYGVIMGQFYAMWHLSKHIHLAEKRYESAGYITVKNPENKYIIFLPLTLLAPMLCHGMYDFLLSTGMTIAIILFFVYLIGLYVYCFKRINTLSKLDQHESGWIMTELTQKYPGLDETLKQEAAKAQAAYAAQSYMNTPGAVPGTPYMHYRQPVQPPYPPQQPFPNGMGQQMPNTPYPGQQPPVQNPYPTGMGQQMPNAPYPRQQPPVQNPYPTGVRQQVPSAPYPRQQPPAQNPPAQNPYPNQTQPPMQ